MKHFARFVIGLVVSFLVLVAFVLVGFQLIQIVDDRKHGTALQGLVLDQDGQPLSGVDLTFRNWNWRYYVPIPWTPARIVEQLIKVTTGTNGGFSAKGTLPRIDFMNASKVGFRQDGPETDYSWRGHDAGPAQQWTLHLVSEALIRQEQVHNLNFESVQFPRDGQICLNLLEGKMCDASNADLVFRWQRLQATSNHGEYGKYSVRAPRGGLWFWEQERLFAPKEGYEDGMVFFFSPSSLNAYMKKRRAEFFVTSRNSQVYARVFAQLDTGNSTLSIRARANASSNRFVGAKADNYKLGVYGSLSPDYLNPGVPWWILMEPTRGQVIFSAERSSKIFSGDVTKMPYPAYVAAHYQTPPDVLASIAGSKLMGDHYVPQSLAKNLAAPASVLQQLETNAAAWKVKDIETTLSLPEDVKRFLTSPE